MSPPELPQRTLRCYLAEAPWHQQSPECHYGNRPLAIGWLQSEVGIEVM